MHAPLAARSAALPDTDEHGVVLILGATSAIARGVAQSFAARGFDVHLAGRSGRELLPISRDLSIRHGVRTAVDEFDALRTETHRDFFERVAQSYGDRLRGVVVGFGFLGDQRRAVESFAHAEEIIRVNFVGVASVLTHVASYFERRRAGFIVGISSVAGDRGRQSNYVYGASKGAASLLLQGLRNRLAHSGVRVLTVKPGFVDTRMTFGLPGLFLVADPVRVGEQIVRAIEAGRDVVYVPSLWRYVMLAVRLIPEALFKRMRL